MRKTFAILLMAACSFVVGCGGDGPVEVRTDLPSETAEEVKLKEQMKEDYKDEDRSQRMEDQ